MTIKRLFISLAIAGIAKTGMAQQYMNINYNGQVVSFNLNAIDSLTFSNTAESTHIIGDTCEYKYLPIIASGLDNIKASNDPRTFNYLTSIVPSAMEINGVNISGKMKSCISIIDDDTIDGQIPVSFGSVDVKDGVGGYFSILLPITLSLAAKNNKKVPVNLACEGHRVGLTSYLESNDNYTTLNENGNAVKWVHDKMGWNVLNHSMTAQLMVKTYFVDGINSELASTILSRGTYAGYLSFDNTIVIDRTTGKWYEVNSDLTAWVERTPTKKYAVPFYREYINVQDAAANHDGQIYFNRDFDFEYSWGEFVKRAEELGLPNEKFVVHNGSTASRYMTFASRRYAYTAIRTTGTYNYPPVQATVNRKTLAKQPSTNDNSWNDAWVTEIKQIIDECKENNSWVVFMSHFNAYVFRNIYLSAYSYPTDTGADNITLRKKDDNYPSDWKCPLNHIEIQDLIGSNVHNYIDNPPRRLNINTWDEWYPAPGTHAAAIYYVLDYAISQGIDFTTVSDWWKQYGNILNIGVDKNGQTDGYDAAKSVVPFTNDEKSYLTIGCDGSIRSFNGNIK